MQPGDAIYDLVEHLRWVIRQSDALFGVIFELGADGVGFVRWRPLLGSLQNAKIVQSYIQTIGDHTFASRRDGVNRSVQIEPSAELPDRSGLWYVSIVSQQMDDVVCVAIVHRVSDVDQADVRQQEVENALEKWRRRAVDLLAENPEGTPWDRLLETCVIYNKSAVLIGGYPAFLRFEEGLRALAGPVITSRALAKFIEGLAPQPDCTAAIPGLHMFDLRYGHTHQFRITILGRPKPQGIIISLLPAGSSPLPSWSHGSTANCGVDWIGPLKESVVGNERDAVLIGGAPPLTWDAGGVHPVSAPVLNNAIIRRSIDHSFGASGRVKHREGYEEFGLSLNDRQFQVAMFGYPSSILLVLVRLLTPDFHENGRE